MEVKFYNNPETTVDIQEKNILQDIHLISDTCFLHGIITNGQAKFYNNPKTKHIGY